MFIVGVETTSRQLISNLSDQPLDLLPQYANQGSFVISDPIFFAILIAIGVALGFILGKRRVISFLVSLYIVATIGFFVNLETFVPGGKTTAAYVLSVLLVFTILMFVIPANFSGTSFWYIKWPWKIIFGILSVGLLINILIQFAPSSWLYFFPPTVTKIFTNSLFKGITTILPLLLLWLAARNNEE